MKFPTFGGLQPMQAMPLNTTTHTPPAPPLPHNPHHPIGPYRNAGDNTSFAAGARAPFTSYFERRAYRPAPRQLDAGSMLQYRRTDDSAPHAPKRAAARKPRDTIPRWANDDVGAPDIGSIPAPRIIPTATASVSANPDADTDTAHHRADALFTRTYAKIFSCTLTEARDILRRADRTLYESWRNLQHINEVAWTPAGIDEPRSPHDLAYAATLFSSFLKTHPGMDDMTASNTARLYLVSPPVTSIEEDTLSAIYQGVLQRGLNWISPDKVRARGLSATQILQAVCRRRHADVNTHAALSERLLHYRDVIIDEAALIAFYAQSDQDVVTHATPMHVMRAQYATALIDEWQDAALGLNLLPSAPVAPVNAKFWYDGAVMQNARGMNLEKIVDALYGGAPYTAEEPKMQRLIDHASRARHLPGQPKTPVLMKQRETLIRLMHGDYAAASRYLQREGTVDIGGIWLTRSELHAIVEKTMHNLMLDTHYDSGTPLHAIATVVRRLGPLHGIYFDQFNQPAELMHAFNRLNHAWRHNPHFPIAPSLCAAHYLAQTSDVVFLNAHSESTPDKDIARQADTPLWRALLQTGVNPAAEIAELTRQLDRITQLPFAVRPAALHKLFQSKELSIYLRAKIRVKKLINTSERISYADTPDLNRQLNNYFKQRLLAQAPLPIYDEDFLIRQILRRKLSMTNADLRKRNDVTMYLLGPQRYLTKISETPANEFKLRSKSPDGVMEFNGKAINTVQELNEAKARAAKALHMHPVIQAKSTEMLRRQATPYTSADLDKVRNALVKNVMGIPQTTSLEDLLPLLERLFGSATLTTLVEALSSGDPKQMLAILPFVIPLYDIEEGIRLGDRQRAWDGALHFGEDAIFTMLGAGAESILRRQLASDAEAMLFAQSRMSPAEHAGAGMMRNMAALMPEASPERLAQRRVVVEEDTFGIHASSDVPSSQTAPKSLEEVSSPIRIRTPDNREHCNLFLEEEQRSVTATPSNDGFVETDSHGKRIPDAPPIFNDPESGRYYRLGRRSGLKGGAAGIPISDLVRRGTVANIQRYWQSVIAQPGIRTRSPQPLDIIETLFKSTDHPLYAEFKDFWLAAYERSDTAVAIINDAFNRIQFRDSGCQIAFDQEAARITGDRITFLSDEDLRKLSYTSPGGTVPFQRIRMWTHESVHWLTKTVDPGVHASDNNRGATVFIVDRILSEFGSYPPIQPRTTYQVPKVLKVGDNKILAPGAWKKTLRQINEWTIAENMHLDKILDKGRDFPSTLRVLGQPIADRITVRQGFALAEHIESLGTLGAGNAGHISELVADAFTSSVHSIHHRAMLKTLVMRSKTFRMLAAAWNTRLRPYSIDIGVEDFDHAHFEFEHGNRLPHIISSDGGKLWLNKRPLYYFSEFDLAPLSPMRRYAGAMIDLFLGDMTPEATHLVMPDPFLERGAGVLLENEVMQQIGDASPKRICNALATNPNSYLRDQTTITRAAVNEDGYLRKNTPVPKPPPEDPAAGTSNADADADARECTLLSCI